LRELTLGATDCKKGIIDEIIDSSALACISYPESERQQT
jgi:hypothetical protein